VSGANKKKVRFRIEVGRDPYRSAAVLPLVAVLGPGFVAGLTGRRNGVRPPQFFSGIGIKRSDKAANTEFAARCPDDHFSIRNERRHRNVIAVLVLLDFTRPD